MGSPPFAARRFDPVGHDEEFLLQVVGMAVGIVIGVVLFFGGLVLIGSGFGAPVGAAAIAGAILSVLALGETSAGIASLLKEVLPLTPTGNINEGARTVFVGEANTEFSRVRDAAECQETPGNIMAKMAVLSVITPLASLAYGAYLLAAGISHDPSEIRTGSTKVLVEGKWAARLYSELTCGGQVADGERSVWVFGKGNATGLEKRSTVPELWSWALFAISIAAFVRGLLKIVKAGGGLVGVKSLKDLWKVIRGGIREELKGKGLPRKVLWVLNQLLGNPIADKLVQLKLGKESKSTKIFGGSTKVGSATDEIADKWPGIKKAADILLKAARKK